MEKFLRNFEKKKVSLVIDKKNFLILSSLVASGPYVSCFSTNYNT